MKTFTILAATALAALASPAVAGVPDTDVQAAQAQTGPERGAMVRGADGAGLGRLEGRRTNADGVAEIVVRDADGQLRAIPAAAVMVHGEELHANWSQGQFRSAPALSPPTATGAPATGAGGNQGPDSSTDATRPATADPGQDATRPTPVESQQAPDARPQP